ncbi:MAG: hypothetical protein JXQ75_23805 [Phycisphaerae bacterium]|nr:hypothetical protein [Phycisphaerae bacterium]
MKRRIGLLPSVALLVAGLTLLDGCVPSGASEDPSTLAAAGLQNLLTFMTDFARQMATALLL